MGRAGAAGNEGDGLMGPMGVMGLMGGGRLLIGLITPIGSISPIGPNKYYDSFSYRSDRKNCRSICSRRALRPFVRQLSAAFFLGRMWKR